MANEQDAPVAHFQTLPKDAQAPDIGDDYEIPLPESSASFAALKDRIKHHYEIASDYYYSLWYVPTRRSSFPGSCLEAFTK